MHRERFTLAVAWVALTIVCLTGTARGEDSVWIRPDVVYGHKDGMALTMDVLIPPRANGAGVLFIQSGGWYSVWKDPAARVPFCRPLLDRGFVVFLVRHGSAPRYTVPEAVDDVRRAVRFTRFRAAEWGISPDRLGAMGISAGGHLAQMLATTGDDGDPNAKDHMLRQPSRIAAAATFCAPSDIRELVANPSPRVREHKALRAPLAIDAQAAAAAPRSST